MEGSKTDTEDFTSASEIYPESCSSESDKDKKLVVVLANEIESHPMMNGDGEGEETIPQILEYDEDSDIEEKELDVLNLAEEEEDVKLALLATKVKNLSKST